MTDTSSYIRLLLCAAMLAGATLIAACASSPPPTPGTPQGCSPATTPCQ